MQRNAAHRKRKGEHLTDTKVSSRRIPTSASWTRREHRITDRLDAFFLQYFAVNANVKDSIRTSERVARSNSISVADDVFDVNSIVRLRLKQVESLGI